MPTSSSLEILARVSMSGCDEFVHHLETVEGFTPNSSDSHLLVFFCSTNTNFKRLISCIFSVLLFGCKDSEKFSITVSFT